MSKIYGVAIEMELSLRDFSNKNFDSKLHITVNNDFINFVEETFRSLIKNINNNTDIENAKTLIGRPEYSKKDISLINHIFYNNNKHHKKYMGFLDDKDIFHVTSYYKLYIKYIINNNSQIFEIILTHIRNIIKERENTQTVKKTDDLSIKIITEKILNDETIKSMITQELNNELMKNNIESTLYFFSLFRFFYYYRFNKKNKWLDIEHSDRIEIKSDKPMTNISELIEDIKKKEKIILNLVDDLLGIKNVLFPWCHDIENYESKDCHNSGGVQINITYPFNKINDDLKKNHITTIKILQLIYPLLKTVFSECYSSNCDEINACNPIMPSKYSKRNGNFVSGIDDFYNVNCNDKLHNVELMEGRNTFTNYLLAKNNVSGEIVATNFRLNCDYYDNKDAFFGFEFRNPQTHMLFKHIEYVIHLLIIIFYYITLHKISLKRTLEERETHINQIYGNKKKRNLYAFVDINNKKIECLNDDNFKNISNENVFIVYKYSLMSRMIGFSKINEEYIKLDNDVFEQDNKEYIKLGNNGFVLDDEEYIELDKNVFSDCSPYEKYIGNIVNRYFLQYYKSFENNVAIYTKNIEDLDVINIDVTNDIYTNNLIDFEGELELYKTNGWESIVSNFYIEILNNCLKLDISKDKNYNCYNVLTTIFEKMRSDVCNNPVKHDDKLVTFFGDSLCKEYKLEQFNLNYTSNMINILNCNFDDSVDNIVKKYKTTLENPKIKYKNIYELKDKWNNIIINDDKKIKFTENPRVRHYLLYYGLASHIINKDILYDTSHIDFIWDTGYQFCIKQHNKYKINYLKYKRKYLMLKKQLNNY